MPLIHHYTHSVRMPGQNSMKEKGYRYQKELKYERFNGAIGTL